MIKPLLVTSTIILRVRLMCALRTHINLSIFRIIFLETEKVVNTFSIPKKFFSKNENYCVTLGHTLAKSLF